MADAGLSAPADAPPLAPPPPADPRRSDHVARAVEQEPTGFDAFQLVRLLERLLPDRAPVGGWADPGDEVVRFTVPPTLAFPSAEVASLALPADRGPDGGPARLAVTFFGLTGPQGLLPHAYTQHAGARARARDTAFADFLDLFHHRALSLFFRAWARPKAAAAHEAGRGEWLLDHLLDVAGLGTSRLRGRLPVSDAALGFYAGLFASRTRPADGLERLVGDYFDVPTRVEQFVGEWRRVDGGGQCALGLDAAPSVLGGGVVGDEAWDPQARVRLRLGPLTRAQFDAFLPGGAAHAPLRALAGCTPTTRRASTCSSCSPARRAAVRPRQPGRRAPRRWGGVRAARRAAPALGRGTWLASRPLARDPDDTTLALC
jgi:type VI secretion system protein ImpH